MRSTRAHFFIRFLMSHPLVIINGKKWRFFLETLQETVCLLAQSDGKTKEEVELIAEEYANLVNGELDSIFYAAAVKIMEYLNFYKVHPTQGVYDEFKGIYFTGIAVSERLAQSGLLDLDKLHQRAMLRLLDIRLEHPHKALRKDLSDRVRTVITHGKVVEHFGKHGWYLIYKCLYNAANEKSKSI